MTLKEKIEADIKTSMLAKDKDRLRALRSIKSLILLAETEKGTENGLNEEKEISLLTKAAKQRSDSAEIYKQQNREDLLKNELSELAVIQEYLPKQLPEEEVEKILKKIIEKVNASGPSDLGKVMGAAMDDLKGKADGKTISSVAKKLLM